MSRVIGRGRYATETYPSGPGGGGGAGGASVPLSRQRFIDGDTVQTGSNGAAAEPFKTIAEFMATRSNLVSIADSTAPYVGWLMPAIGGYVEDVAFPAFAVTELRADSFSSSLGSGTVITGDITWHNVTAPGIQAGASAGVALHNISVDGSITITDGAGAPSPSEFIFGGDEVGNGTSQITGSFTATGATHLSVAFFTNADISGNIAAGGAGVGLVHSNAEGTIACAGLQALDSGIISSTITTTGGAVFTGSAFGPGSHPVLTCGTPAIFDGSSYRSFLEGGGTRGVGTIVLVIGGYGGAPVEGAALAAASTTVTLNGTNATAGFTGENCGNHYSTASITPTTVTLETDGALPGDTMLITRTAVVAADLAVVNGGAGAGTIGIIPTTTKGFVLAQFDGTNWSFAQGGSLAA